MRYPGSRAFWVLLALAGCAEKASTGVLGDFVPADDSTPRLHEPENAGISRLPAVPAQKPAESPIEFEDLPGSLLPTPTALDDVGSGMAVFDADGDGDLDVLVPFESGLSLFLNQGSLTFTQAGTESGIVPAGRSHAVALGDCDGDGDLDVFVSVRGGSRLLVNLGGGTFADATTPAGITRRDVGYGEPLFFDADGDGDLDLYVSCYSAGTTDEGYHGCPAELWMNDGACHFHEESVERGIVGHGFGLAVAAFDPDGDGAPDLVVSNDFGFTEEPNQVWHNDGTGHFTDVAQDWGLATAQYAMTASVGDLDGDGLLDVYVGNICENRLFLGGPGPSFREASVELGVEAGWVDPLDGSIFSMPRLDPDVPRDRPFIFFRDTFMRHRPAGTSDACLTSWGAPMADLDADGQRELFVAAGRVGEPIESPRQPDQLFHRSGSTGPFTDIGEEAGVADPGTGHVAMFADLDGDGRLDLLVADILRTGEAAPGVHVLRNVTPAAKMGHHLAIDLRGQGANTWALGAAVEVWTGGKKQVAYRSLGESYLGSNASPMYFGLGAALKADQVVVRWPWNGGVDVFRDLPAGKVTLLQGTGH